MDAHAVPSAQMTLNVNQDAMATSIDGKVVITSKNVTPETQQHLETVIRIADSSFEKMASQDGRN